MIDQLHEHEASVLTDTESVVIQNSNPVILLVDDESALRRIVARMLRQWGWNVAEAGTRTEAQSLLGTLPRLDLVLSDYHLPDGNGLQILESWRSHPRQLKPFILMSGLYRPLAESDDDPDYHFLPKPFSADLLRTVLEEAMSGIESPKNGARAGGHAPDSNLGT